MSVPKKRLTILFTPLDGWGHINCSHGLAEELLNRGHRVVFAVDESFKDHLTPFGFEEELLTTNETDSGEKWFKIIEESSKIFESKDPTDVAINFSAPANMKMIDDVIQLDSQYRDIIERVSPDLIVVDNYVNSPAITNSGRPWIWLYSAAALGVYKTDRLPPKRTGFPTNDQDTAKWKTFRQKFTQASMPLYNKLNDFCVSKGAPPLPPYDYSPVSPYLNIYLYIKELDYTPEVGPLPKNYMRVENFIRTTKEKFEIPKQLRERSGGLVFLSMGSFGCANLKLMTRLVNILSKSKHRFIVAKGPLHDKYELPDNMWGQKFVPQMAVLPVVDAVITHGGNNTVTEAFFFGKPMLVMPLFGDQYDNAQRIFETGLGFRLNPFHCTEEELITSVDKLISDQNLIQKCKSIGDRIRNTNDKKRVA